MHKLDARLNHRSAIGIVSAMPADRQIITTREAAEILGVTDRRVLAMIAAGNLKAERYGYMWMLRRAEVVRLSKRARPVGRPRKPRSRN